MHFFKNRESGFGSASLLGLVSAVAAGGIYLHNLEADRSISLTRNQIEKAQIEMDLYSALGVASSLFQPSEGGSPAAIRTFKPNSNARRPWSWMASSGRSDLWSVNRVKGSDITRDFELKVKRPTISNFAENDWDNIANGKLSAKKYNRDVKVQVDSIQTNVMNGEAYDEVVLRASLVSSASGQTFQKIAALKLDRCFIHINGSLAKQTGRLSDGKKTFKCMINGDAQKFTVRLTKNGRPQNPVAGTIFSYTQPGSYVVKTDYGEFSFKIPKDAVVGGGNSEGSMPSCRGKSVGGFCFFLGGRGQSCDSVCGNREEYDSRGTGWANNRSNCLKVMRALGAGGAYKRKWSGSAGCKHYTGTRRFSRGLSGIYTTGSVKGEYRPNPPAGYDRRACACKVK